MQSEQLAVSDQSVPMDAPFENDSVVRCVVCSGLSYQDYARLVPLDEHGERAGWLCDSCHAIKPKGRLRFAPWVHVEWAHLKGEIKAFGRDISEPNNAIALVLAILILSALVMGPLLAEGY